MSVRGRVLVFVVLTVASFMAVGVATAALAIRTDQARAQFTRSVDACIRQELFVGYTAGTVKDPVDAGVPGS